MNQAPWAVMPLEAVCVPSGLVRGPFGGSLKKIDFVASGYRVYEQRHAINGTLDGARYFVDAKKFQEMKRFSVRPGDFIVSCSGTIGRIYQLPKSSPEGIINQALLKVTVDTRIIEPQFFTSYFEWDRFQEKILESTQGGAMQNLVGMATFRKVPFIVPPIQEQRRIAEALRDSSELIDVLERLIAKKQAIKQGMMQQLLTGKTRLPGFSSEWVEALLGDHVLYVKTVALSRAELDTYSPLRYLHYGDIHTSDSVRLDAAHEKMPRASAAKAHSAGRLQVGDLVFADASEDSNGVGKSIEVVSIPESGVVPGLHTIAARFDKTVLADGFKAYLQFIPGFRDALLRLASGTKVLATTRKYISSVALRLPEVAEQHAIAAMLQDVGAEISALERQLENVRNIRQGMMQELLTGRTRLTSAEVAA